MIATATSRTTALPIVAPIITYWRLDTPNQQDLRLMFVANAEYTE